MKSLKSRKILLRNLHFKRHFLSPNPEIASQFAKCEAIIRTLSLLLKAVHHTPYHKPETPKINSLGVRLTTRLAFSNDEA